MKIIFLNSLKIILSLITIPLWFVKFFVDIGYLPNVDTGKIEETRFYHSMFENMKTLELSFLFYGSIVIVMVSIVLSIVSIKTKNQKISKISNIVSITTIGLFFLCLLIASIVDRRY